MSCWVHKPSVKASSFYPPKTLRCMHSSVYTASQQLAMNECCDALMESYESIDYIHFGWSIKGLKSLTGLFGHLCTTGNIWTESERKSFRRKERAIIGHSHFEDFTLFLFYDNSKLCISHYFLSWRQWSRGQIFPAGTSKKISEVLTSHHPTKKMLDFRCTLYKSNKTEK